MVEEEKHSVGDHKAEEALNSLTKKKLANENHLRIRRYPKKWEINHKRASLS